jgi:hypothetical protein
MTEAGIARVALPLFWDKLNNSAEFKGNSFQFAVFCRFHIFDPCEKPCSCAAEEVTYYQRP